MKVPCWNCSALQDPRHPHCCACGQRLWLDDSQRAEASAHIEYLIAELRRWKSVPEWWKKEAEASYRKRLEHLARPFGELPRAEETVLEPPPAPERTESVPEAAPASQPVPLALQLPARRQAQPLSDFELPTVLPPAETEPSEADRAVQMLREALSEKRILWLYALGGLLLLSAGVGYLRSSWDGMGRQLMALFLTVLPGVFFWLAAWLRQRLPVSSRMFNVLGGGLLPVGLLSLNTFHFFGLEAPPALWNPMAFLVGAGVNAVLSRRAHEPVCLYLAGLCWALASWSTSSGLWLGLSSFAAALFLFTRKGEDVHRERLAHAFSMLGLIAAFTRGPLEQGSAVTLFLLAVVYFSTLAWLQNTAQALTLSALVCVVCFWWLSSLLGWPAASVGLAVLLQGSLYLVRAERLEPDTALSRLPGLLVSLVLLLFLGLPLLYHLTDNFAEIPDRQLWTGVITGLVGCGYYGFVAVRQRRPAWVYGAALSLLYAYFSLIVLGWRSHPGLYRPWLVGFILLWQVLVAALRRTVPPEYLRPWVWTAWSMACLLVPLNLVLQLSGADRFTPWVYLGCALVTAMAALFERDGRGLYVSLAVAALAYAGWLQMLPPASEPNLGLAFTPFVAALGGLGAALLRREATQPYGKPLVVGAAVLASGLSWLQALYLGHGYWHSVPPALAIYGLLFALAGWPLQGQLRECAWLHAGLCWLSALACLDRGGPLGVGSALAVCVVLMCSGRVSPGWWWAAGLWSAAAAYLGPASMKIWPGLIWLLAAAAARKPRPELALVASGLLVPAWPGCWENWRCLVLAGVTVGQVGLALRWTSPALLIVAWCQAKVTYLCALGWPPGESWFAILWAEWLLWYALHHRAPQVLAGCEFGTWGLLLALSRGTAGPVALLSNWASVLFLLWRGVRGGQSWALVACDVTLVFATLLSYVQAYLSWEGVLLLLFGWGVVQLGAARFAPVLYHNHLAVTCLAWCLLFFTPGASSALFLGSGVWVWRAWLTRALETPQPVGSGALWLAFGLAYHGYLKLLFAAEIATLELYTVPVAAWLLFWGSRLSDSPGARQLGTILWLAPSMLLSLFLPAHALWAGSLALLLLLLGQSSGRANYVAWAGLAVISEIVIQAVIWGASNLPWHMWAVIGGVLVVGLAIVLERKRQAVLEASRGLLQRLNAW